MKTILAILLISQISVAAEKSSVEKVKTKANETIDATKEYASDTKEEYAAKMHEELNKMDKEITELKNKAIEQGRAASQTVSDETSSQLSKVEAKRKALARKLAELDSASDKAWTQMRKGIESAWGDLKTAFKKASSQFDEK